MAKFVIECPNCGRYAQARTGFFAKKKIECSCGYVIDVKTDRMSTRICPHCGNTFVYDAAKGTDIKCPVCHQNFMASQKGYTFQEKQVINQQLNVFLTVYSKGESSYRVYTFQQGLLSAAYAYEEIKHYSEVKKYLDEHYSLVHEEETYLAYTIPEKTKLITLGKESDKKGLLLVTYTIGINPD